MGITIQTKSLNIESIMEYVFISCSLEKENKDISKLIIAIKNEKGMVYPQIIPIDFLFLSPIAAIKEIMKKRRGLLLIHTNSQFVISPPDHPIANAVMKNI
ncbi:hypothetical protein AB8P51_14805 [Muriicola sp. SD30]|uniref:hypothetical protein n=1 Tax=Muriicola sp. SD30 TaxID=3240936 RepID=UPI00350F9CE2